MSSEHHVTYRVSEIGCRASFPKGRPLCEHAGENHFVFADNPVEACQMVCMFVPPCTDCGLRVDIEGGVRVDQAPFPIPPSATIFAHVPTYDPSI